MSVELKDLVRGALVLDLGGNLAVVMGPNPGSRTYPILYKLRARTRGYKGSPMEFQAVVGSVDMAAFEALDERDEPAASDWVPPDSLLPDALKGVKPGDAIKVRHGFGKVVDAVYEGYSFHRPKYPLSYSVDGRKWKASLQALVSKAA